MDTLQLEKVKRPGNAVFRFEMEAVVQDEHGQWFLLPAGSAWAAPHDRGSLPFGVVVLLAPHRPWVAWWAPWPHDPRIEIDTCLPPEQTAAGWRYIDLELDVFRHEPAGEVSVEDRDEFELARRLGYMSAEDAYLAEVTACELSTALAQGEAPWIGAGWSILQAHADETPEPPYR